MFDGIHDSSVVFSFLDASKKQMEKHGSAHRGALTTRVRLILMEGEIQRGKLWFSS